MHILLKCFYSFLFWCANAKGSVSSSNQRNSFLPARKYEAATVEATVGKSARLSCNMTVSAEDSVYLVLWFKQGLATPIYSYDVREVPTGKHWYDSDLLGNRATFHAHPRSSRRDGSYNGQPGTHLLLKHLRVDDAGVYKCRVDFQKAPTMITRVNLTVVVPPESVSLHQDDSDTKVRGVLGPVRERDNLTVVCIVKGGHPRPSIRWLIDGEMLPDETSNQISSRTLKLGATVNISFSRPHTVIPSRKDDRGYNLEKEISREVAENIFAEIENDLEGKKVKTRSEKSSEMSDAKSAFDYESNGRAMAVPVKSELLTRRSFTIYNVSRELLKTRVECVAKNSRTLPTVKASATLDMNLAPLGISISTSQKFAVADRTVDVTCSSWGSRPPALISWWSNGTVMATPNNMVWAEGNESRALLRINAKASDNGRKLSCRSSNPSLVDSDPLLAETTLNVHYPPVVTFTPGRNLDLTRVQEGDDVYFECSVKANPPTNGRIYWKHSGTVMKENIHKGVLITESSLVLQTVSRRQSGSYSCGASNSVAYVDSEEIDLNIRYKPVCRKDIPSTYGVSLLEEAVVICKVNSYPEVLGFVWWFNNSAETLELKGDTSDSSSVLRYTPVTDLNYGSLLCLAHNEVGKQKEPCTFQIIPAALPEAPTNCSLANLTSNVVTVACSSGFDGGLDQTFVLEVYTKEPQKLFANLTSKSPRFAVTGLPENKEIELIVYSGNSKGRSVGVARLVALTPELPVKQLETRVDTESPSAANSPLLGILAGTILVMVVLCIASIALIRIKCKTHRMQTNSTSQESLDNNDSEVTGPSDIPQQTLGIDDIGTQHPQSLAQIDLVETARQSCSSKRNIPLQFPKDVHPQSYTQIGLPMSIQQHSLPPLQNKYIRDSEANSTDLTKHIMSRSNQPSRTSAQLSTPPDYACNYFADQKQLGTERHLASDRTRSVRVEKSCECPYPIPSARTEPCSEHRGNMQHNTTNFSCNTLPRRISSGSFSRSSSRNDLQHSTAHGDRCVSPLLLSTDTREKSLVHLSRGQVTDRTTICQQMPEHRVQETKSKSSSLRRKGVSPKESNVNYNPEDDVIAPAKQFQDPDPGLPVENAGMGGEGGPAVESQL